MLFKLKADAERKRAELIAAAKEDSKESVLSNFQIIDARRALERLSEAGLSISLDRAIELALPTLKASGMNITVSALLAEFAELKARDWRPKTARNFREVQNKVTAAIGSLLLSELTPPILQKWLAGFTAKQVVFMVRTINPAFSYAVRQGMIPFSPFERVEMPKVQQKNSIDIFTPAEASKLMQTAPEDCKAAFACLLFAGVRPTELTRLKWENVREGFIFITSDVAKTAQIRNIEIEPNLAAWLYMYKRAPEENICPTNWSRKSQAARAEAGLSGRQDTARHSYATYHLQKYKDKGQLEANMGHMSGSAMLMRHYRAASTPAEAAAYWSIYPNN